MRFSRGCKTVSINWFRQVIVWVIKTLQYDRIVVSEGIDINKTKKSKECMLCHYWYFKNVGYKFQPYLCNGCHAVSMTYELKNIAILNVKVVDYRCILWNISKDEAVNRLKHFVLEDKSVL